jgi:hypothetical protein
MSAALAVVALLNGAVCAVAQLVVTEALLLAVQHVHTNLYTLKCILLHTQLDHRVAVFGAAEPPLSCYWCVLC